MKALTVRRKMTAVLLFWLGLAGCVTQPSGPTRFYMLAPLTPQTAKASDDPESGRTVVLIEPVQISAYLDRNHIVSMRSDTEYLLAEFDRWAEPIGSNLTRVMVENLFRILSSESVLVFPAARSIPFDYSIEIEVMRMDGKLGDTVTLIARWAIFGAEEDDLVQLRRSEFEEPVKDDTYKGFVLAESRAVEKLCRQIADAMKKTLSHRGRPPRKNI